MGRRRTRRPGATARGKWSVAIRDQFLELLRESGNAIAALRIVGHPSMFYKRRRRDPVFAAQWAAAVAEADARLSKAENAFPGGAGTSGAGTVASNCPLAAGMGTAASDCPVAAAEAEALLRPGPKRKPEKRELVIRRARGGRVQIALAHEGHMTAEIEADFLARLRATGNFRGSALALGFQPASLFERARRWPAFAKACDEALAEASIQLDYALVAHAHKLLRRPGDAVEEEMGTVTSDCSLEEADDIPFDPDKAMRILGFIDRRRSGRTTRGRRKGPPQRSFDEAIASVLAKIEAIERHEQRKRAEAKDANGDGHGDCPQ